MNTFNAWASKSHLWLQNDCTSLLFLLYVFFFALHSFFTIFHVPCFIHFNSRFKIYRILLLWFYAYDVWIYKIICSFTNAFFSRSWLQKPNTKNCDGRIKWTAVNEWNINFIPIWWMCLNEWNYRPNESILRSRSRETGGTQMRLLYT